MLALHARDLPSLLVFAYTLHCSGLYASKPADSALNITLRGHGPYAYKPADSAANFALLGGGRFLKTLLCVPDEGGLVVVKVRHCDGLHHALSL